MPEIGAGEALVRTRRSRWIPTNRAWISDTPTYLPPVAIGEVMRAVGLGGSSPPNYADYRGASWSRACTGWQDYVVASAPATADADRRRSRACHRAASSARSA